MNWFRFAAAEHDFLIAGICGEATGRFSWTDRKAILLSDSPSPPSPITPPTKSVTPAYYARRCSHTPPSARLKRRRPGDYVRHAWCLTLREVVSLSSAGPEYYSDGMNAYMAYKVTTKTSMSLFKRNEFSVKRRFSDFLGLHSKLASKYLHIGYIVPPAPEKSIVGMTKVKVGKEDQSSNEFVEKRRSALERYLMRTVKHPVLLKDPDVPQFLESSD
ncbi:sorting nexin-2, partial [Lates japonicus]